MRLRKPFPCPHLSLPPQPDSTRARILHARRSRSLSLCLLAALLCALSPAFASAQKYTSIVVFGDSLSDTGNVADLTFAKYHERIPGLIADYADGRFTDGLLTVPASRSYDGVWVEQLARRLPADPKVIASLDHGTDYAYGFAVTGGGTSVFVLDDTTGASVTIENIGLQISDYLAGNPRITDKTLFVLWGGAIDVLYATSPEDVVRAALKQTENVQRLIDAGATRFLVPNLPPLGDVPRLLAKPVADQAAANEATILFNDTLDAGLSVLPILNFWKRPHVHQLNVYGLFKDILASPHAYGFDNVTSTSQGNYLVNPDTYLFWDDLHPTTYGHDLLSLAALKLIDPEACYVESLHEAGEMTCETLASLQAGRHP